MATPISPRSCWVPAPTRARPRASTATPRSRTGRAARMLAARQGHGALVGAMLAGGANPETATDNGTTPLMFAAASGDVASGEAGAKRKGGGNARRAGGG